MYEKLNEIRKSKMDLYLKVKEGLEMMTKNPMAVQTKLLMELLEDNKDTEYGKKYGFRQIRSYEDYASMVPLSDYSDYEPYIERMIAFNQKNLITADEVVYYAHTSGTSGTSKMIPCSRKALDILSVLTLAAVILHGLRDKRKGAAYA